MADTDPATLVRQENQRLAALGTGLRLEIRQQRLGLRGPLPCPKGTAARPVQRISLGLPATGAGVTAALEQLHRVRQSVEKGTFRWEPWRRRPPAAAAPAPAPALEMAQAVVPPEAGELLPLLAGFEAAFFADPRRRRRPAGSRSTWSGAYRPYLRRLAAVAAASGSSPAAVDAPLLERVLETYPLASRSRQQCGIALGALARHLQLPLPADWSERSGGYGLHVARFRGLPSDARILELVEAIPNPRWRLAYGLMATYGLRNHEIFFCDLSALAPGGDRVLRVLPTSKTGEHQVWPFQPDWVEHFGLEGLGEGGAELPRVCTDLRRTTLQQVGRRVAEQFRRYGLPITPYDLRHAWAVRTIHIGLPDTVAARMMGHSVAIHTRTYHHWITRRDQQQAVDTALARLRAS
ncbi:site-specific integrase [Cyanobium sp. Cruz CV13-4-11]|uniref:site-specific integrase n=1 Tax=unclassified Cyanobium TaxID=2627006 RepID=UPI0020CBC848|nr:MULTISPECIES: site-specific integrase [unclassified Cyanobium]MCP9899910.1 site-specific integrase [Cyanobium sp. Cruz CV11-17]MCP9918941.1 site-specific integrase [Cyanobium sp. Cruz CV13-4-11]